LGDGLTQGGGAVSRSISSISILKTLSTFSFCFAEHSINTQPTAEASSRPFAEGEKKISEKKKERRKKKLSLLCPLNQKSLQSVIPKII
jgi:hypothetical protein